MHPNRSELALLRGKRDEKALSLWAATLGSGDPSKAEKIGRAVATFLGQPLPGGSAPEEADYFGQLSPNTRKAYTYAITEFFEWAAAHHQRIVSPEQVTRLDTEAYVSWLTNRPFSLAAEKLGDGDKEDLKELYEIIEKLGQAKLEDIVEKLNAAQREKYFGQQPTTRRENRRFLSDQVRRLVTMDVVHAAPTMEQLRQEYPQAGITTWTVTEEGKTKYLEDVFTYSVKEYKGVARTTVAQRVSALSSFWRVLAQGENIKGGEALLQFNIWEPLSRRVGRNLSDVKKLAAQDQKMDQDLVIRMMRDAPSHSLEDLRNKAMLYLMVFAGLRTTELLLLRRSKPERGNWKAWFDGSEPPSLQIVRKGGKIMRLPYPPVALKVLIEFQRQLELQAAPPYAQYDDERGDHYIPRDSSAWYFRDLNLPEAPLFPPLFFWGAQKKKDYRRSMSRQQVFRILRKMGEDVGMTDAEVDTIHPHAIRHFSANAMVLGGKDIREVQAILGHSSLQTTEGYLEDPQGDVKLSGQNAILDYLNIKGVPVQPVYTGDTKPQEREVIETRGEVAPIEPIVEEVAPEELEVLQSLEEVIPEHELPAAPPEYDPAVVVMAMPGNLPPVVETKSGLVGLDGTDDESAEALLEDLPQTSYDGQSPGSPAWVYEAMADPKATHETVVFNRGGERDIEWLKEEYPTIPKNFGVGNQSYLPWYVKARGNISRGGYFQGLPPFPVFAPEQCHAETTQGEAFLQRIEAAYSELVHGNVEKGLAPSPLRSVGMVRWYSFFVYHATKFQTESQIIWKPWNSVVPEGEVRIHEDAWLVQWLQDNAHTYRASVDAMKRGVSRTDDDITASFLKSSFEGIELITDVPEWMVYNDPIGALYESDPREWNEMIAWLKNVTGQKLEAGRKEARVEQREVAIEEQKTQARMIRDVLLSVMAYVDQLSRAKHTAKEKVDEARDFVRTQLYWYATAAGSVPRLTVSLDKLKDMTTAEFNKAMAKEYARLGVPDPNASPYKELRGKRRVSAILATLFPDLPELADQNVFAQSALFDPRWFRIDEDRHTLYIDESERQKMQKQFGQDPQLLVRRATRAMWEARDRGHEALWGILMSYFSWIVPSGAEMESKVLGIPLKGVKNNLQARKTWLKAWSEKMRQLAMGQAVDFSEAEEPTQLPEREEDLAPWQKFLQEEAKKTGEDALDHVARKRGRKGGDSSFAQDVSDGLDFALSSSVSGRTWREQEEEFFDRLDGEDDYYRNPTRFLLRKNGKASVAFIEGERPAHWYQVDLFGRREGTLRPNAPPQLVSPGVVYRSQKRVFAARQLLPSPFRMVAAMDLSDE